MTKTDKTFLAVMLKDVGPFKEKEVVSVEKMDSYSFVGKNKDGVICDNIPYNDALCPEIMLRTKIQVGHIEKGALVAVFTEEDKTKIVDIHGNMEFVDDQHLER